MVALSVYTTSLQRSRFILYPVGNPIAAPQKGAEKKLWVWGRREGGGKNLVCVGILWVLGFPLTNSRGLCLSFVVRYRFVGMLDFESEMNVRAHVSLCLFTTSPVG